MTTPGTDLLTKIPFLFSSPPNPNPSAPNSIRFKGNLGGKECQKKKCRVRERRGGAGRG